MKKLLLLLTLSYFISCSPVLAQKDSTLTSEQAINFMSMEFTKSHKEYMTGVYLSLAGGVIAASASNMADGKNNVYSIAGIIGLAGLVCIIDSHRHIKKAGKIRYENGSLVLKFR